MSAITGTPLRCAQLVLQHGAILRNGIRLQTLVWPVTCSHVRCSCSAYDFINHRGVVDEMEA